MSAAAAKRRRGRSPGAVPGVSDARVEKILAILRARPWRGVAEIAAAEMCSKGSSDIALIHLHRAGVVAMLGKAQGYPRRIFAPPGAAAPEQSEIVRPRPASAVPGVSDARTEMILCALRARPWITAADLAQECRLPRGGGSHYLPILRRAGMARMMKIKARGPGGGPTIWAATGEADPDAATRARAAAAFEEQRQRWTRPFAKSEKNMILPDLSGPGSMRDMERRAYRRDDGVLVCPPARAGGYEPVAGKVRAWKMARRGAE